MWTKPFSIHPGLRMQPHDLVGCRLVSRDTVAAIGDQLLDQLGARGLVLDQHELVLEEALRLEHRAFEGRKIGQPAEHTEEKEVLAVASPSRTIREITAI